MQGALQELIQHLLYQGLGVNSEAGQDSGGHLPLLHQAGDGQIRVLRMGGREMFSMTCIHAKMNQSKVMCLARHPHRAGLLALEQMRGSLAGWRP